MEVLIMKKTPVLNIAILCISALIIVSCVTKNYQEKKDRKPPADSEMMGKPGKPSEKPIEETDVTAEKRIEAASSAAVKEVKSDQDIKSEVRTFESTPIYFDFDSSLLTPDARSALVKLAKWLQANPQYFIEIEGHSDERGSEGYNLALGETRAASAKKYLHALAVEAHRISTLSYGEEKPADTGKNETAWAKNRRIEFKLIRKP
jgi:peptidoglycan-associated lipoprotein